MDCSTGASIQECFADLPDPRVQGRTAHKLLDIIVITICAVICGADGWVDVEAYGKAKQKWLEGFLELPAGIPSHDTFGRVFSLLSPTELQRCFLKWVQAVAELTSGEVVAIDGKTARRSYARSREAGPLHMVSAWASANSLVLGQVKTEEKSNEITAVPKLLQLLDVKGCIVTLDAMGCQRDLAKQIRAGGADYVLALKGNQGSLHGEVREFFEDARRNDFRDLEFDYHETVEKGHGREEIRRCWTVSAPATLPGRENWEDLNTIALVESERHTQESSTTEARVFLSSLDSDAKQILGAVRDHWTVENALHWVLDIAFREDDSRIRTGHAPENLAVIRHLALNLLKQEKSTKRGIKVKRKKAGWDNDYLLMVIGASSTATI